MLWTIMDTVVYGNLRKTDSLSSRQACTTLVFAILGLTACQMNLDRLTIEIIWFDSLGNFIPGTGMQLGFAFILFLL
ncbi:MAG: hypothetical protein RLN96_13885, partial [Pseudomonadales bacterium]